MQTSTMQTTPAGAHEAYALEDSEPLTTMTGPIRGGVSAHLDSRDGSAVLAVDGYDMAHRTGLDLTPESARRLAADLTATLSALGRRPSLEAQRAALELQQLGPRATATDMQRIATAAGVPAAAVADAWEALAA